MLTVYKTKNSKKEWHNIFLQNLTFGLNCIYKIKTGKKNTRFSNLLLHPIICNIWLVATKKIQFQIHINLENKGAIHYPFLILLHFYIYNNKV